jgi:hypothetical protein
MVSNVGQEEYIMDTILWVLKTIWISLWWILTSIAHVVVWIIARLVDFALLVLKPIVWGLVVLVVDLVVKHPGAAIISLAVVIPAYFAWRKLAEARGIELRVLNNPNYVMPALWLVAMALTGFVGGSSQYSVHQVLNIQNSTISDSTIQAVPSGNSTVFHLPTEIWSALIAAVASIGAAVIGLRKKD